MGAVLAILVFQSLSGRTKLSHKTVIPIVLSTTLEREESRNRIESEIHLLCSLVVRGCMTPQDFDRVSKEGTPRQELVKLSH